MATLPKAEYILKRNLEEEGLSLDKAPTLKSIVLKTIDDIINDHKETEKTKKTKKQVYSDDLHAKRLARCVNKLIELVGPSNNQSVKEGETRLSQYKRDHPDEQI